MASGLVVFLAIYGGILIFTSGDAKPNPYLVLFACLAASVFSEEVWRWVGDVLAKTTGEKIDDDPEPQAENSPALPDEGK